MSSAWKNVGMTVTCNGCDVIDIILRKTQKSDREKKERK